MKEIKKVIDLGFDKKLVVLKDKKEKPKQVDTDSIFWTGYAIGLVSGAIIFYIFVHVLK